MKISSVTILAMCLSFSTLAYANTKGNQAISPEQRVNQLTTRLNLTPSQQQEILQIFTATQAQREDIQQQMQMLREQTRKSVAEVLTPEQQALFETMGAKRKLNY